MTKETGPENYINSETDTVISTQAWMFILNVFMCSKGILDLIIYSLIATTCI